MLDWMRNRVSREELLGMWLASPSVRAFETGRITAEVFADQLIEEMGLPVNRDQLLTEFSRWPVRLLPGALDLVGRIPRRYTRATLSNTNALHWPRVMHQMQLDAAFDRHFASHLTGKIKPDEEAFQNVTEVLGCKPEEILFLDDSHLNVGAARKVGINSVRAIGVAEAERILIDHGVVARTP
jgi:putative hydrolase of the HAD superfamily